MSKITRVQYAKEYVDSNQCEVMDTTMAHEASFLAGWAARGKADREAVEKGFEDSRDDIWAAKDMKNLVLERFGELDE